MLQLRHIDYQVSQLLPVDQTRLDNNILRQTITRAALNIRHIHYKDIADAMLPFYFKGISLKHTLAEIATDEDTDNPDFSYTDVFSMIIQEMITDATSRELDNNINLYRIYTNDINPAITQMMAYDFFEPVPDAIQSIYNKVGSDTHDRSNYNAKTVAYYNLERHSILLLSNYDDYEQASDSYLTIGLLPVLFPHVKELLDESEINYCKAFVRRAQIKRITNTFIADAFRDATGIEKFKSLLDDVKYRKILDDINYCFTVNLENQLENSGRQVESYLRGYEEAYNKFVRLQKQIADRMQDKDRVMEESKIALKSDGVVDFRLTNNRSTLELYLRVPCLFYEQDEAELVTNRLENRAVKQLFTDIFLENKYTLWICNRILFKLISQDNEPPRLQKPGEVPLDVMQTYKGLYNPHTHYYQCIGDYEPQLIRAQADMDLLGFVNLALASTKSINFRDGAVINRFTSGLEAIFRAAQGGGNDWMSYQLANVKCLEDVSGELYSIKELYIDIQQEPTEVDVTDSLETMDEYDDDDEDYEEDDDL